MANMNVTYAEMETAAQRLQSGQEQLTSLLGELKKQVDDLVAAGFVTDQASGAFQGSYEQFTTGAVTTVNGLEGMYGFLHAASQALQDVDSQLASRIGG